MAVHHTPNGDCARPENPISEPKPHRSVATPLLAPDSTKPTSLAPEKHPTWTGHPTNHGQHLIWIGTLPIRSPEQKRNRPIKGRLLSCPHLPISITRTSKKLPLESPPRVVLSPPMPPSGSSEIGACRPGRGCYTSGINPHEGTGKAMAEALLTLLPHNGTHLYGVTIEYVVSGTCYHPVHK